MDILLCLVLLYTKTTEFSRTYSMKQYIKDTILPLTLYTTLLCVLYGNKKLNYDNDIARETQCTVLLIINFSRTNLVVMEDL